VSKEWEGLGGPGAASFALHQHPEKEDWKPRGA
jgi:hypothetical protein